MMPRSIAMLLLILASVAAHAAGQAPPPAARDPDTAAKRAPVTDNGERAAAPASSQNAAATQPQSAASASTRNRTGTDRLDLETTVVTGNRELPKVLYIVPWKKAELGDLPGQPFNSLLDEALTPVDRDVFRREVTYYEAVSTAAPATPATGRGTEK